MYICGGVSALRRWVLINRSRCSPQPQIVFTSELGHPPKFKDTNRGEDEINMSENYNDKKTRYDSKVSKN